MVTPIMAPSRTLLRAFNPSHPRPICECIRAVPNRRQHVVTSRRLISTAHSQRSEMEVEGSSRPRWIQTPPAMKAPVRANSKPAKIFECNTDAKKLDDMYVSLLGPDLKNVLSDETKWLAITHKSFDHGRRGFNERLAYLGKRIVELQLSLGLLNASENRGRRLAKEKQAGLVKNESSDQHDPYHREPFSHPAIDNVDILASKMRRGLIHHTNIAALAHKCGIPDIMRWQPRNPESLRASGSDMIYAEAVFAIVGGIALERGGAVANQVAKEKILRHIGVRMGAPSSAQLSTDEA